MPISWQNVFIYSKSQALIHSRYLSPNSIVPISMLTEPFIYMDLLRLSSHELVFKCVLVQISYSYRNIKQTNVCLFCQTNDTLLEKCVLTSLWFPGSHLIANKISNAITFVFDNFVCSNFTSCFSILRNCIDFGYWSPGFEGVLKFLILGKKIIHIKFSDCLGSLDKALQSIKFFFDKYCAELIEFHLKWKISALSGFRALFLIFIQLLIYDNVYSQAQAPSGIAKPCGRTKSFRERFADFLPSRSCVTDNCTSLKVMQ